MDFVRDFGIARLIVTFPSSPTWSTSSFPCSAIDQIRILCWWQDLAISKNVGYTYIDSSRCHCWSTLFWLLMVNLLSFATGPHQRRHCHDLFFRDVNVINLSPSTLTIPEWKVTLSWCQWRDWCSQLNRLSFVNLNRF